MPLFKSELPDIGKLIAARDIPGLVEALRCKGMGYGKPLEIWINAHKALREIGEDAVGPLLARAYVWNANHRTAVIEALAEIGDPRALGAVLAGLKARKVYVRRVSAGALEHFHDELMIEPLLKALEDSDSSVRADVAKALERFDIPVVQQAVKEARVRLEAERGQPDNTWQEWARTESELLGGIALGSGLAVFGAILFFLGVPWWIWIPMVGLGALVVAGAYQKRYGESPPPLGPLQVALGCSDPSKSTDFQRVASYSTWNEHYQLQPVTLDRPSEGSSKETIHCEFCGGAVQLVVYARGVFSDWLPQIEAGEHNYKPREGTGSRKHRIFWPKKTT